MSFRLLFDSGESPQRSLDQLSYEEWLEFVFDHPAAKKDQERWYSLPEAENWTFKDSSLFLRRLTCLLGECDLLLSRYSVEQIRQGFWCFISAFELPDLLEDKELDFSLRAHCVAGMEELYRRLFRRAGFEKIAFMYWDPLAHSFDINSGMPDDPDHRSLQNAMFDTLVRILNMPDRISFLSALHGLGHLGHERAPEAIRKALARRKDLLEGDSDYAQACLRGDMDQRPAPQLIVL